MPGIRSLEDGLDPVRDWFNREAKRVRIVGIQSAT
jgi:hypothetical protein